MRRRGLHRELCGPERWVPPGAAKEHAAPAIRTRQLGDDPEEHESFGERRAGQATVRPVAPT
eukprot:3333978-Alexandrium_andersonii.AAC.1